MNTASLLSELDFNENRPSLKVLLETDFSKEIRIIFRKGQLMKKHQAPYPIVIEIFEGEIDFGVGEKIMKLKTGDLISLEGGIPHDLNAIEESIVRLTLSKLDQITRVEQVVKP